MSNPDDVAGLVKQAREAFGPIAILVNNAGIGRPSPVFDNTLADFDATFAANVRSAFLVTQAVRDLNFGRLIFLWSAAAMTGGVISTAYASSKAAVVGMMHHYAASLAPWNITANAISPAFIETDIFAGIELPPAESPPLGRMGRPDEVAEVAQMIVNCGFITGQTIQMNAGRRPPLEPSERFSAFARPGETPVRRDQTNAAAEPLRSSPCLWTKGITTPPIMRGFSRRLNR